MSATGRAVRYTYAEVRHFTGIRYVNFLHRAFEAPSEPFTWLLVNFTTASPNAISVASGAAGLLGSVCFFREQWGAAALAYAMFFVLDCCDGTVARLTGRASVRGGLVDLAVDRTVLVVAILTRAAFHLRHAQLVEAWLCALYLASHYAVDLRWLMDLRERAAEPAQLPALKQALQARLASAPAPSRPSATPPDDAAAPEGSRPRSVGGAIWHVVANLLPSNWVTNIAFVMGSCFLRDGRATLYLVSALALHWSPLVNALLRARSQRKRRAQ